MHLARERTRVGFALLLVLTGGLLWQRNEEGRLRKEVAERRLAQRDRDDLRRENERLTRSQTAPVELERLRAEHIEIARLRRTIVALKAGQSETVGREPPARSTASLFSPVNEWKNLGCATPQAALQTVCWAAAAGEIDTLESLLLLEPEARVVAEELLARIPATMKATYGTPDRLAALCTARDVPLMAMHLLPGELKRIHQGENEVILTVVFENEHANRSSNLTMRQMGNGWRLVIPESAIANFAGVVNGTAPAAPP